MNSHDEEPRAVLDSTLPQEYLEQIRQAVGQDFKLLDLRVPRKATWMRMCLAELNRIHSHLVWLGTAALEIGAISMFWYCFREREQVLDLFEMSSGQRMHTRYFQVGGVMEDIPPGWEQKVREFIKVMPQRLDQYLNLLDRNEIWLERTRGVVLRVDAAGRPSRGRKRVSLRACREDASHGRLGIDVPSARYARRHAPWAGAPR